MRYSVNEEDVALKLARDCRRCGACEAVCAFLADNGDPAKAAKRVLAGSRDGHDPFHCSLCGLCAAVCPHDCRPQDLFLAMRRSRMENEDVDLVPYKGLLAYESFGGSGLASLLMVPRGGDTVLFPGCALAARTSTVRRLFRHLQADIPGLGVALGCCFKPSHDLGRAAFFLEQFGELHAALSKAGVRRILTACPNCQKTLGQYASDMEVVPVYEVLSGMSDSEMGQLDGEAMVHDCCPQRDRSTVHDAVRTLAQRCGLSVVRGKHERKLTRCCGEGGGVRFVRPEYADLWSDSRKEWADGRRIVTSCAGCVGYLGAGMQCDHVLDLFFDSKPGWWVGTPMAYAARILLKLWFGVRLLGR